jgi:enoyl-CoA hydratase/carnithine racemase
MHMLLTGTTIDAAAALRAGLVSSVVDPADLLACTAAIVGEFA